MVVIMDFDNTSSSCTKSIWLQTSPVNQLHFSYLQSLQKARTGQCKEWYKDLSSLCKYSCSDGYSYTVRLFNTSDVLGNTLNDAIGNNVNSNNIQVNNIIIG